MDAMLKALTVSMLVAAGCSGCLTTAGDNDSLAVECGEPFSAATAPLLAPRYGLYEVEWRCQTPGHCSADLDHGAELTLYPDWMDLDPGGDVSFVRTRQASAGCITAGNAMLCPRSSPSSHTTGGYAFWAYEATYEAGKERWMGCAKWVANGYDERVRTAGR